MAVQNGTDFIIQLTTTQVSDLTSNDFEFTREMRNVTTKNSGGNSEFLPSTKSWTASLEVLVDQSSAYNLEEFYDAWEAGTPLPVKFTNGVVGNVEWSGTAYITSVSPASPMEDNVTCTVSLQGTGAPSKATIV